MIKIITIQQ